MDQWIETVSAAKDLPEVGRAEDQAKEDQANEARAKENHILILVLVSRGAKMARAAVGRFRYRLGSLTLNR